MGVRGVRILRVFPRKTVATPDDELVRLGEPDILDLMSDEYDEVHISVTFTYDKRRAEYLAKQWEMSGRPVKVGGPAYDDRMGDFTPGLYIRKGYTFTSRGCPNNCWFCSVAKCAHGVIRELPIRTAGTYSTITFWRRRRITLRQLSRCSSAKTIRRFLPGA